MHVPEIYPIGTVIKEDESETMSQTDVACLKWLDGQLDQSVLLISMGSGGTLTCQQMTEMAWGLELNQQRIVWVVRRPADASRSGTFFYVGCNKDNDPRTYLPEGSLDRNQGVGVVVPSWITQVAVLGHRSTGAFLTHSGWNSTIENIAEGVPMIAWPLYAEQRTNATLLMEDLGVTIKVKAEAEDGVVGREEIARTVRVVMEGEERKVMRTKVRELMDSVAEALERGGSSDFALASACMSWKGRVTFDNDFSSELVSPTH